MELQDNKTLASANQRKAGIVSIHRLAGVDAVCLYALDNLGLSIEHSEVLELGKFLNCYISDARPMSTECCSDTANDLAIHIDAPIEWHLGNFARYVKDHRVTPDELRMMISVAIGARAVIVERPNVKCPSQMTLCKPSSVTWVLENVLLNNWISFFRAS